MAGVRGDPLEEAIVVTCVPPEISGEESRRWLSIAEAKTVESLGAAARTLAREVARSDGATFVLREGDRCFYADEDSIAPLWKGQRFPINECISGWAMLHHEPAVIPDIYSDDRIPQAAYATTYVHSLVSMPVGDPSVAAIGVYWASQGSHAEVLPGLQSLADQVGARLTEIGLSTAPWAPNFTSDDVGVPRG